MRGIWLSVLLCLLYATGAFAQAGDVDAYVRAEMQKQQIPGLSLAVVRDGKIVKEQGYGLASIELNVPASAATVYQIGSVTKQFTAVGVLLLVDDGKIALDDAIGKHLSDLPEAWRAVTVRQLLTHTSAIKSYTELPNFAELTIKPVTPRKILESVAALPIQFAPGAKWQYSNTGYVLLGMLIEKGSGKGWGAFLRERIFAPLGMNDTRANVGSEIVKNRADGYTRRAEGIGRADYIHQSWPYSAGALLSTVGDLAKWQIAMAERKLLKSATWDAAWSPVVLADKTTYPYGFGFTLDAQNKRKRIAHGGAIPGFLSYGARYPDDNLAIVVLTNSNSNGVNKIAEQVAALYVPMLAVPVEKPIEDKEPEATDLLRDTLTKLADGTLTEDAFTKATADKLFPDGARQAGAFLKSLGALTKIELLERTEMTTGDTNRLYRYRVLFGATKLIVTMGRNKDGKITGLGLRPE